MRRFRGIRTSCDLYFVNPSVICTLWNLYFVTPYVIRVLWYLYFVNPSGICTLWDLYFVTPSGIRTLRSLYFVNSSVMPLSRDLLMLCTLDCGCVASKLRCCVMHMLALWCLPLLLVVFCVFASRCK